ncbi:hypothetical protein TNCV_3102731 [Trichonephila clavipes]|nr:hypothetical protein TNCV_3102731 [Trichonephila clavipes]
MPSTYRCAESEPLRTAKGGRVQKKWPLNQNAVLCASVAYKSEIRIGMLHRPSPDTSSMIVRTEMEAGFVAKHYTASVSMIPT